MLHEEIIYMNITFTSTTANERRGNAGSTDSDDNYNSWIRNILSSSYEIKSSVFDLLLVILQHSTEQY